MREKNIFAYKLFLLLNLSDLNLFFMSKLQPTPPRKNSPPLSQQPPLKVEVLSSPPLHPVETRGGGAHYVKLKISKQALRTASWHALKYGENELWSQH